MERWHAGDSDPNIRLSNREREILHLLDDGLSDREIAERLNYAISSVKWYNRQIYNKLGVDNRQQAVDSARKLGLLPGHESNTPKHNLPAHVTPFVGREHELEELVAVLNETDSRLVTLLAAGGMGKTRLALAAAERVLPDFPDGVYFVPLVSLISPQNLDSAIANAVGCRFLPNNQSPKEVLLNFLRNKNLLLILDNYEHLLEDISLIAAILEEARQVKILVTSRERLNLSGEAVYPLGGLPYPEQENVTNPLDYSSVQLFVQSARRSQPRFRPDEPGIIARLCRLVAGMPLAIELAAAWVNTLSLSEIVDEITHSLDFLQTDLRDVPERLRSIRAVFQSSWKRLNNQEQMVFSKLSVFQGGCTREGAKAVADAEIAVLAGLVNKALVWRTADGRYDIHELLRQYAGQQLEAEGIDDTTRQLHARYFAQFASRWGTALKGKEQADALNIIEAEIDNIRRGMNTAIEKRDAELLALYADLWLFFDIRGWYEEAIRLYERGLEQLGEAENAAVGKLLTSRSVMLERMLRVDEAYQAAREGKRILRACGLHREALVAFCVEGNMGEVTLGLDASYALYQEAYEIAVQYGDTWATAAILFLLGNNNFISKGRDLGIKQMQQAYTIFEELGNVWGMGYTLSRLANVTYICEDYDNAYQLYQKVFAIAQKIKHPLIIAEAFEGLGLVAWKQARYTEAMQLYQKCADIYQNMGVNQVVIRTYMARTAMDMGDYMASKLCLTQAFKAGKQINATLNILNLALILAECNTSFNLKESAVELLSVYSHHPQHDLMSIYLIDPDRPTRLLEQLKAELSPAAFTAAWERGSQATLEATLEKFLQ